MKTNKKEEIRKSHTGKLIALALVLVGALVCIFWMFRNLEITKLLDDIDVKQSEFESKSKCIEHRDEIETKMSKTEWTSYKIEDVFL